MNQKEFTWESFVTKKIKGYVVFVSPLWRFDSYRKNMFRLSKKGYFKVVTKKKRKERCAYGDYFERTDKSWIDGDSPKKTIQYSLK